MYHIILFHLCYDKSLIFSRLYIMFSSIKDRRHYIVTCEPNVMCGLLLRFM